MLHRPIPPLRFLPSLPAQPRRSAPRSTCRSTPPPPRFTCRSAPTPTALPHVCTTSRRCALPSSPCPTSVAHPLPCPNRCSSPLVAMGIDDFMFDNLFVPAAIHDLFERDHWKGESCTAGHPNAPNGVQFACVASCSATCLCCRITKVLRVAIVWCSLCSPPLWQWESTASCLITCSCHLSAIFSRERETTGKGESYAAGYPNAPNGVQFACVVSCSATRLCFRIAKDT